ncbi:MAG TPA: phage baseplate assembly protein V, partial [Chloroflexia bacterium]|nr:phage baseplate assembly protein V [Chloroflexia bacterium]
AFMPEANDEVVVAFDHGDPNFGVVLGAVWNGSDHLPKPLAELVTGSTTIRRVIKTRVGHIIIIDDTEDPGGFVIQDKTGDNYIKIATQPNTITVQAKSDILIQSTTGKITIDGNQGVFLKGNQGDVAITTDMNVTASAQQQAKVDAQTGVQLSTPAQMTMSGTAGLSLSTTAQLSMSGTAGVGITGAGGVNITGPGPISIKGIPISLG